ncbi:MAG: S-ribosylhomocysteine lyase [Clostridia bacterium]|jgi:S-ribosylhomocysteine lyase|nr:S-ribosylhomocysteine lyase [Clostridia bacterium]
MAQVESFSLDHTKVKAPYVRKAGVYTGPKGDKVSKFDLRFTQPNKEFMNSAGMHALEHLMATYMRDYLEDIIDLSPMGCRTGFYLTVWGEPDVKDIISGLEKTLKEVVKATEVPATTEVQCGNYLEHSLEEAVGYANKLLSQGISDKVFG